MNDPPLAKGDIGGFSKLLNPPLPPFSKGGNANKYMPRVINHFILFYKLNTQVLVATNHNGNASVTVPDQTGPVVRAASSPAMAEILSRVIILQLVRFHSINRDEVLRNKGNPS
jgi:hypothetical protein